MRLSGPPLHVELRRQRIPALVSLVVLAAVGGFPLAEPGGAQEEPTVHVSEPDWPPYFFAGDEEAPPGIAREVIETCVRAAGFRPEFVTYPIERMRHYVVSGELDVVTFSYREDREETMQYGEEVLFVDSYHPVVRKGSGIEIDSIGDFDDLRLGHVNGLRYSPEYFDYVRRREEAGTSTTLPSTRLALDMLQANRIDVFVGTRRNIEWLLGHADRWSVEVLDFVVRAGEYFVTVTRASRRIADRDAFLAAVDACIAEMKTDGRYDAILASYR